MAAKDHATGSPHAHAHDHAHGGDCCGGKKPSQEAAALTLAKDPVCGMSVDPHTAKHRAEHGGRTYYFCSAGCRTKFIADPAKVPRKGRARGTSRSPEGTIYTCPMHPRDPPGRPGLVPDLRHGAGAGARHRRARPNPELVDMQRRFWIGARAGACRSCVLEMGGHLTRPASCCSRRPTSNWLQLVLATPVVLWAGWPFFERGWQSLQTRNLNMFTLIAMGTGVAWVYSVIATVAARHLPAGLPRTMTARSPSISRPPPSSPCWCCSARCSNCVRASTPRGAIRALLDLAPKTARRIEADGSGRGCRARRRRRRRPAARPARREGAGRRHVDRGPLRAR